MTEPKRKFNVRTRVNGTTVYRAWKEWEEGEYVIGTFEGTKIDNYDKTNYRIKVLESNFGAKVDAVMGLNSCGGLDKAMEDMATGTIIQVTYTGMTTIAKGKFEGKAAHGVEVAIMEEEGVSNSEVEESSDDL